MGDNTLKSSEFLLEWRQPEASQQYEEQQQRKAEREATSAWITLQHMYEGVLLSIDLAIKL